MVIPHDQDLFRELPGPVHMIREQRGKFVVRSNPTHERLVLVERQIAKLRAAHDRDEQRAHATRVNKRLEDQQWAKEIRSS